LRIGEIAEENQMTGRVRRHTLGLERCRTPLHEHVPMGGAGPHESSFDSLSERIDVICDAFEGAWREGLNPRIEAFVETEAGEQRSALLRELIEVEIELRRKNGESPNAAEYVSRFPEEAAAIRNSGPPDGGEAMRSSLHGDASGSCIPELHGKIAHFTLLERLGTGRFGSVWRTWDERLERTVAIRLPRAGEVPPILSEARAAAQLRHPFIVSVHEVSRDDEQPYIVSDYIAGPSLQRWMLTRRPTPRESAWICESIARALQHAHEREILHRDLKPANILMDSLGDPHISDFGLTRCANGNPFSPEAAVSDARAYIAPEQARGDDCQVDCRSDIYSLGIILYELLAGHRPFEGRRTTLLRKAKEDAPRPLERMTAIPRDLQTICFKAMSRERDLRYATASELADDLQRFQYDQPIRARRAGWFARTWRWCRNRLFANSITAALMAFAAAETASTTAMSAY
jgi:serine/threonine-protein kinase